MLAHVLIQRQNGTERIALGKVPPQRVAICINVKVDEKKKSNFNPKRQQFIYFLKHFCHGLFLVIISEWQLEPVVVMATVQRDVWRGKQDTCSHMLQSRAKMEQK